uniref:Putative reverse transcriptase domain-containing protein n=1 Tax=Tanacetum cinerariifolium TaxID=118510 RepID=A0A699GJ15_TANCI|nr:putative reverse transcriptase domain-containing protein [Tanacetum cinerariifolium]
MLRAYVIDYGGRWGVHLPLAELSYNNSYHSSIQHALFEALYGRKYKSHVLWAEIEESSLTGLELVQETTNKVVLVKEKPKAARHRQKSYVDNRRKPLEFKVGDHVLLKLSPWKGVNCFGKKRKLAPRDGRDSCSLDASFAHSCNAAICTFVGESSSIQVCVDIVWKVLVHQVSIMRMLRLREVARETIGRMWSFHPVDYPYYSRRVEVYFPRCILVDLAEYMFTSRYLFLLIQRNTVRADNRPPTLEKSTYNSWQSRMILYIREDGVIRARTYEELTDKEKIRKECDIRATNIVLQGLPSNVYNLVNHHTVAKEMFTSEKGETIHAYYLRFAQQINDMNTIGMTMQKL